MMLEHAFHLGADSYRLHWIAQQVAYHAHATGMWYLHEHGHVGTMLPKRRVRGMPDTLPAEDAAPRFDLDPLRIKHMTAVTEPFRSELPSVAMGAALHEQPVLA